MNIFEVLKHEEHNLQVITIGKTVSFGCVDCGEVLLDNSGYDYEIDLLKILPHLRSHGACNIVKKIEKFKEMIFELCNKKVKSFRNKI